MIRGVVHKLGSSPGSVAQQDSGGEVCIALAGRERAHDLLSGEAGHLHEVVDSALVCRVRGDTHSR